MSHPILAPVFNVSYACSHDFLTLKIRIQAEGEISDELNDPYFVRDRWLGGYKFSLMTTRKEVGTPVQRHFVAKPYEEYLPLPPFVDSILIETASGVQTVPINKLQLNGGDTVSVKLAEASKPVDNIGDVLPPLHIYLPADQTAPVSAPIPKPEIGLWPKTSVNTSFHGEYLELVDAEATVNNVTWYIKWRKMSDIPQVFQVTKTSWNGELGPGSITSRVVQPYIFHFVVFKQ